MPWPTGYGPAAPGGCCPMTYRPGRPSTTPFAAGGNKACGNRSTACCASRSGSGRAGGPRPARRSWTARASRPPNGGRHGYDGAKRLNGRKRHLLVDPLGLVIKVHMTAADVGDRDGAAALLRSLDRRRFPRLRHGWADGGYRDPSWTGQPSTGASPSRSSNAVTAAGSAAGCRLAPRRRSCPRSPWPHAGGWWSGPSPGWGGTGGSARTTNTSPPPPKR
jgi:hypothetical protein